MTSEIENKGFPYLFRYRPNNDYTIDEIQNSYIYFPNREKLNDPFDSSFHHLFQPLLEGLDYNEIIQKFKNSQSINDNPITNKLTLEYLKYKNPSKEDFNALINDFIGNMVNERGIACFTLIAINIMLWAIYANNHQGICIQYNMDYDKLFFANLSIMNYVDSFDKVDLETEGVTKALDILFNTKLSLWSNEHELRIVKEKTGRHNFNALSMRSIIFGLRTDEEYKKKVIEVVKEFHPHIELYNSSIIPNRPGLRFERIDFM